MGFGYLLGLCNGTDDKNQDEVVVEDALKQDLKEVRPSRDLQSKSSRDTPGTTVWKQVVNKQRIVDDGGSSPGSPKLTKSTTMKVISLDSVKIPEVGVDIDTKRHQFDYVVIREVYPEGAVAKANEKIKSGKKRLNADLKMETVIKLKAAAGDRILSVNGKEGSREIVKELQNGPTRLEIELQRGATD